uniref:Uncharacterized protein LOC101243083 n=1 Tax=Phallusia mammillata TaxID=59560 RepID=A0A6F9DJM3_9ASCI|nr:uncharacterized protein LOC101243083 [Phallusia mammillata]
MLRFIATGDSYSTIAASFRTSKSTIFHAVPETCVMPILSRQDWLKNAEDFDQFWQFPNCVGSVDGKNIVMQAPNNSGSMFYNYKHSHSIVLLAVADSQCRFICVDVGAFGKQSDGSVFANSAFGKMLEANELDLPGCSTLRGSNQVAPYVFVGDEAFALKTNFMRPFPGRNLEEGKRIFNYRLSRARRTVENTFGILSAKWRVFRRPIPLSPCRADAVVKACCVLHNYLRNSYCDDRDFDREDRQGQITDGSWREEGQGFQNIQRQGRRNSDAATKVREIFQHYFSNEGQVTWQLDRVNRC